MGMTTKEIPNKITAVLKVTATAEFFDDEASKETVRYAIEQDLEGAGFDVDVALLKEQEAVNLQEQKPPLGIKPYYIAAWQRIGELIEAIERQYESADGDAGLVEKWANEIGWQASMIEALRGGQDKQEECE